MRSRGIIPLSLEEAQEFLCSTRSGRDEMTTFWGVYTEYLNKYANFVDFPAGTLGPIDFRRVMRVFDRRTQ